MVTETRRLIFTNKDLIEALDVTGTLKQQNLPAGRVAAVEIEPSGKVLVVFERAGGNPMRIMLTPGEVGTCLLAYCRLKKIPMPRAATKALEVQGDNLSILVTLAADQIPLTEE